VCSSDLKVAASPSTCRNKKRRRITERLAGGVKGLTARFDVLLVTISTVRPPRMARATPEKQRRRHGFR